MVGRDSKVTFWRDGVAGRFTIAQLSSEVARARGPFKPVGLQSPAEAAPKQWRLWLYTGLVLREARPHMAVSLA